MTKEAILEQINPVLRQYDVPPPLVSAIIQVESNWDPRALGDGGTSYGLFQLHYPGGQGQDPINDGYSIEDLYNPTINTKYAMRYIAKAWERLKGSFDPSSIGWWLAFAAASGHPGGDPGDPATRDEAPKLQAAYRSEGVDTSPAPTPVGSESYTVQPGDSMSAIAQHFGISLSTLEAANPQIRNPNLIQIGELLHIPKEGQTAVPAPPIPTKPGLDITHPWVAAYFTQESTNPPRWKCRSTGKTLFAGILHGWQLMNGAPRLPVGDEINVPGKKSAVFQQCESGIILYDPERECDAPNGPWTPCYLLKLDSPLAKQLLGAKGQAPIGSTKITSDLLK